MLLFVPPSLTQSMPSSNPKNRKTTCIKRQKKEKRKTEKLFTMPCFSGILRQMQNS
jgi:hypothetical protein